MVVQCRSAMVVRNKRLPDDGMVMAGIVVHRLALQIDAGERARQSDGHRPAHGQQHGKNHQERDAKELHESKVSRRARVSVS